jgi:hypothetical protein
MAPCWLSTAALSACWVLTSVSRLLCEIACALRQRRVALDINRRQFELRLSLRQLRLRLNQLGLRLDHLGLGLRELAFGLIENSLKRARIDLKQDLILVDLAALRVILPDEIAGDLRLNLGVHESIGNGDPIADDGNVLVRGVGNLDGYGP